MAKVVHSRKACSVNPLKMSQPIGAALAFMGLRGAMPLLHGSQGCTSFGLVLFVRHFKEAIPLQTTAMSEVATVLGGYENVEQAVLNIIKRTKPELIGIASTGVTETKGDDVVGYIELIRQNHPELRKFPLVYVSTPDFKDAFQDGWEKAVTRLVEELVEPPANAARRDPTCVNVLPGSHLTPGDIEELRTIIEDFGLEPTFLPDLGGSLDGHIPDDFTPTTIGGVSVEEVATMGDAGWTIAVGAQMRPAAEALQKKAGVPFRLFERLCGLAANDDLMALPDRDFRPSGAGEISPPARATGRRHARRPFPHRRHASWRSAPNPICSTTSARSCMKWARRSRRPSPRRNRRCWKSSPPGKWSSAISRISKCGRARRAAICS